jgi:hypothetical protein
LEKQAGVARKERRILSTGIDEDISLEQRPPSCNYSSSFFY